MCISYVDFFRINMVEEDWGDVGDVAAMMAESAATQVAADLPEVKLFGRWSCDDVEVSDMSLQVSQNQILFIYLVSVVNLKLIYYI